MSNVLTGAIAIIKKNGVTIGKMKNIRATESTRRAPVRGLGTILPSESPVVEWSGSLSCSFYEVDFSKSGVPEAIRRDVQTNSEFEDQLLLDHEGVQLDIFKKVADVIDPETRKIKPKTVPYAIIKRCLINSDGFDISEAQISGHDQSFEFLDPIIYPS